MPLDLTIIIPCYNDHRLLERLLRHIALFDFARAVIVVDDASTPALSLTQLSSSRETASLQLTLLRHDVPKGAGAARNLALSHVDTTHLMFMDADDLPTRELPRLCGALVGQLFDFCIFQHHDSRMSKEQQWGQMPFDQVFWNRSQALHQGTKLLSEQAAIQMVQTANYPWNKIYRSDFLQDNSIRCSSTRVHNDIELHWRSFFQAETILTSDHVGMTHFVDDTGTRITNRRSSDRLEVFIPLTSLAEDLKAPHLAGFRTAFFQFSLGLLLWVKRNLDPEFHPNLRAKTVQFLAEYLSPETRENLRLDAPGVLAKTQKLLT